MSEKVERIDGREGQEIQEVEDVRYEKPPIHHRARRHCMRRWWIYLIILLLIIMIVVLLIASKQYPQKIFQLNSNSDSVYVAFPKIAQDGVNDSSIEITELQFLSPSPDSVLVTQKATVKSTSDFTPTLDSFNASVSLVENGTVSGEPFTYLPIPSIHATSSSNVTIDNVTCPISNTNSITAFAAAVLGSKTVTTRIAGKTDLHEGKLPIQHVSYNKSTTFDGLNNLAGFNITNATIDVLATAGESNFFGNAFIPNPSVITIEMGNVTFSLTANGTDIGNATINEMTLRPGNNSLPLTGIVDETAVLLNANSSGFVDVDIAGKTVTYNGERISYYEDALSSASLSLWMNVVQILADSE